MQLYCYKIAKSRCEHVDGVSTRMEIYWCWQGTDPKQYGNTDVDGETGLVLK